MFVPFIPPCPSRRRRSPTARRTAGLAAGGVRTRRPTPSLPRPCLLHFKGTRGSGGAPDERATEHPVRASALPASNPIPHPRLPERRLGGIRRFRQKEIRGERHADREHGGKGASKQVPRPLPDPFSHRDLKTIAEGPPGAPSRGFPGGAMGECPRTRKRRRYPEHASCKKNLREPREHFRIGDCPLG